MCFFPSRNLAGRVPFTPGDAAGLALQVIALLENAALRTRMGTAGRARVEELFSVKAMAAQYMRIIEWVLKS